MKIWPAAGAVFVVLWLLSGGGVRAAAPLPPTLDPETAHALLQAEEADSDLRVIVYLREQPPNAPVSALQSHASHTQAALRAYLEEAQAAGQVVAYTPFWIFNGIAVRATPEVVRALAVRPDVTAVHLDHYRRRVSSVDPAPASALEWNIARIRAGQVWAALNISGTGAVVAGMDSGVDRLHPALQANYRGYNPHGPANHLFNWYDATPDGSVYPVDGLGHGTHTLGTAVGGEGLGVAPGARWIGVRVLNNGGYGYDSWIHAGFQWLLAPGGDPAMAPDVVNCSWGNQNGALTTFQPDLRALRAAGIMVVFAAGNTGPHPATVNSPAALPEAFAVGASDEDDEVADFSGRGPSHWGAIRPHVVAPGVGVRSALPGGVYGAWNGTSMAAPHVSGLVALLRSVSPTLTITRAAYLITATAVPPGEAVPNNDYGWGRVDALSAVAALLSPGSIGGAVTQGDTDRPLAGATVRASRRDGPGSGLTTTDADGRYFLPLTPGLYDLTVSAFGYQTGTLRAVPVTTGTTTTRDVALTRLPSGYLEVRPGDGETGQAVTATVTVLDTPFWKVSSSPTFTLPSGRYVVRASTVGYHVATETVIVHTGGTTVLYLPLEPAPTILLVDSGRWYYGSQGAYLLQALEDLGYGYDIWEIGHLPADVPPSSTLAAYDVVLWTAPRDSPGYIGAEESLVDYLNGGGRLFLTGQDIGYWDGGGAPGYQRAYYNDYLKARYVGDDAPSRVLDGVAEGIFAGLTITITGGDGADNQTYPDEVEVYDFDSAESLLRYRGGEAGAIGARTCLGYRTLYFSFGFEAIGDRDVRREVLARTLAWLTEPAPVAGVELDSADSPGIGLPGDPVTHIVRLRHLGQAGVTDTFRLSLEGVSWESGLFPTAVTLAPCGKAVITVTATVPPTATWNAQDVITLVARSTVSPAVSGTLQLTSKHPAPLLLVDDDRWYDQAGKYRAALEADGLPYDYWHTGEQGREPPWGSPPPAILSRYPVIIWFTGYDWYCPVTEEESLALQDYLDAGGRLFLSSQDFLWYHHDDSLAREYLGVLTYTEDITPTLATGVTEDPIGDHLGSYPLLYPFLNRSDGVRPTPGTSVSLRDGNHNPIALSRTDRGYGTAFFSFPCETLPEEGRRLLLERAVGRLSWLGQSGWRVTPAVARPGGEVTFTLRVQNDGSTTITASFSNTLPAATVLVPGSVTGPATYSPATRRFTWTGELPPGTVLTETYRVTVAGTAAPEELRNTAFLRLEEQGIGFRRTAVVRVAAPDLSLSSLGCSPSSVRPGGEVTCTLALRNTGPGDALTATAIGLLPPPLVVGGSPTATGGEIAVVTTGTVRWSGGIVAGGLVTASYRLDVPTGPAVLPPDSVFYHVALLSDGQEVWERPGWVVVVPRRAYLPVLLRDG